MKHIIPIPDNPHPDIIKVWEENMQEPWSDYNGATRFVQVEAEDGVYKACGGFAIYWDESDGIEGHFISGWSRRKNLQSVVDVILHAANKLGEVYIKTDKPQVKIIAQKYGELVKKTDRFAYYIIRGNKNG